MPESKPSAAAHQAAAATRRFQQARTPAAKRSAASSVRAGLQKLRRDEEGKRDA